MLFSSIEFLFLFLPTTLIVYYLLGRRARNSWLLASSLFFYAWGEPSFVFVMLASIAVNYIVGLFVDSHGGAIRLSNRVALAIGIVANIGLLGVFKYANFITGSIRSVFPSLQGYVPQTSILLPIGISFFTFQAMSYLVDVYRGVSAEKNPVRLALYIALFPQLIAGPIVRFHVVSGQIRERTETFSSFSAGVHRFLVGFNKKMLLANAFAATADSMFQDLTHSVCGAWLGSICYTFQIYFDFSGYSDMAIGLGMMFGFSFPENFNYPYISRSFTEFWRRWHMSLGTWFRDYLYIPLGGSRVRSKLRLFVNLWIVWLATGFWHGANWTFIVWGALYGGLVLGEKICSVPTWNDRHPRASWCFLPFVFLITVIGWTLFRSPSLGAASLYVADMFGIRSAPFIDSKFAFEFGEIRLLLLAAIVAAVPWTQTVLSRFSKSTKHRTCVNLLDLLGRFAQLPLFVVSASCLVMKSHNPFIYFNF